MAIFITRPTYREIGYFDNVMHFHIGVPISLLFGVSCSREVNYDTCAL